MGVFGRRQIIDHNFGRPENFRPSPVTALCNFQDGVIKLGRIMALGNCLMLVWVERLADNFSALDTVLREQQAQLLQRHRHTLMKLLRSGGYAGGQRAFEIINDGQQFLNE